MTTHAIYANPDLVADRTIPRACPERERLAAAVDRLVNAPLVHTDDLMAAAVALQAHKDSCPACQQEAAEIELARAREGIPA